MKAPEGRVVSLYYDSPRMIELGDCLITKTKRVYFIVSLRRQTKGLHVGRWHIMAMVLKEVPEFATVHPIIWYRRSRRRTLYSH